MMHSNPTAAVVSDRRFRARAVLACVLAAALAGCASHHPKPDPVVARKLPPPTPRTDGAIFQAGQQMELFADLKARRVGMS